MKVKSGPWQSLKIKAWPYSGHFLLRKIDLAPFSRLLTKTFACGTIATSAAAPAAKLIYGYGYMGLVYHQF
jgi:hypothetical protein